MTDFTSDSQTTEESFLCDELDWVVRRVPTYPHQYETGMCQCGSEKVITQTGDQNRMRASLLVLVFIDQFVYSHYARLHDDFYAAFPTPKLKHHAGPGYASPSWFVYTRNGWDEKADWSLITKSFEAGIEELRRWLAEYDGFDPPQFYSVLECEIKTTFDEKIWQYFLADISQRRLWRGQLN